MTDHWLLFGGSAITGCQCGFETTDENGYGDSVVEHLLGVGWDEGYESALGDHEAICEGSDLEPNPYASGVA